MPSMLPSLPESQVNVYGAVPPVAEALQLIGLPAVPELQDAVMTSGCGATIMGRLTAPVAPLASVTLASIE